MRPTVVIVWCRGDVMAGTALALAGQSDSEVAVSIASSALVGGCRVVSREACLSSGSLYSE